MIDLYQYYGMMPKILDIFHEKLNCILQGLRDGSIEPNHREDSHLVKVLCSSFGNDPLVVRKYSSGEQETLFDYMREKLDSEEEFNKEIIVDVIFVKEKSILVLEISNFQP